MAISANTLIARTLKILGVLGKGSTLRPDDADDGLFALNQMVESWGLDHLQEQTQARVIKVLTALDSTYTVGVGGNINIARPHEILGAAVIAAGDTFEMPVRVLTDQRWRELTIKTLESSEPSDLWYEKTFPLGIINLYPVPSTACTLVLYVPVKPGTFLDGTTTYDLLPGYERAYTYNLAIELAPLHGAELTQEIVAIAHDSLAAVKRQNIAPQEMRVDEALLGTGGNRRRFDWRTGK